MAAATPVMDALLPLRLDHTRFVRSEEPDGTYMVSHREAGSTSGRGQLGGRCGLVEKVEEEAAKATNEAILARADRAAPK